MFLSLIINYLFIYSFIKIIILSNNPLNDSRTLAKVGLFIDEEELVAVNK